MSDAELLEKFEAHLNKPFPPEQEEFVRSASPKDLAWQIWQAAYRLAQEDCARVCDAHQEEYGYGASAEGCADEIRKGMKP